MWLGWGGLLEKNGQNANYLQITALSVFVAVSVYPCISC